MSPTLPTALLAKLSPTCRWRGCDQVKANGCDHCAPHHEKQRGYEAKSQAKRRATSAAKGECRDCGSQLPRRWNSRRCKSCQDEQAATAKSRRVKDAARRVKNGLRDPAPKRSPKGHYKTEVFADGASRTRFVGQSHRGGPTREEQDASLLRLLVDARRLHEGFLSAFPASREAIDALPRIQRTEAWELLASQLTRSARLQLDVAGSLAATWRETCAGCGRAHAGDEE